MKKIKEPEFQIKSLTPTQIVNELNKFIIGQDAAKKAVAIALRNRWRRQQVALELREEIMPNNIILIGPTGVGKTEIARRLAKLANAPFIKVEASKYTEVGYVGRDVESMVRELTEISVNQVKSEKMAAVKDKAQLLADEKILDILMPPLRKPNSDDENGNAAKEDNQATRERFREKLKSGSLDNRMIEFDATAEPTAVMQVLGPFGTDDLGINFQELLGNVMPKKKKKRKMAIKEAREFFANEESQKLIDMEAIIKEASFKVENSGIIFIDEIDKIAGSSASRSGPDVSREGVQRDLLPIVEGSTVNTKYGPIKSDHVLFIASGAFHIAKPSDLIPELQGRFPIRVELQSLNEDDFVKILTIPENALLKQYTAMLASEGVEIAFDENSIKEIAKIAAEVNEQVENIGARRLHTILTTLLEDILFSVPDIKTDKKIKITKDLVQAKLKAIVKDRDLSKYIL